MADSACLNATVESGLATRDGGGTRVVDREARARYGLARRPDPSGDPMSRYTLLGTARSGPTYKVALALSLMGEPFRFQAVDMAAGEHKSPAYLALNRFGQVPTLVDGTMGRNLCQSAAILDYLADQTGLFAGRTPEERIQANEWMYWDFDRLAAHIYRASAARLGFREVDPATLALHLAEGDAALGVLEAHLGPRDWLVGRGPTIADIDLFGVVVFAPEGGFDPARFPALGRWTGRMAALPGFILPGTTAP